MEGVVAILLIVLYVLPSLIAAKRRHHNTGAISVLNVLLGWTVLGWVASLIWAITAVRAGDANERAVCPFCRESMALLASVCPHCRREMPEDVRRIRRATS